MDDTMGLDGSRVKLHVRVSDMSFGGTYLKVRRSPQWQCNLARSNPRLEARQVDVSAQIESCKPAFEPATQDSRSVGGNLIFGIPRICAAECGGVNAGETQIQADFRRAGKILDFYISR